MSSSVNKNKIDKNSSNVIAITKKQPPALPPVTNKQYDLFSMFFGDQDNLSNTIELWDGIPKYFVTRRSQTQDRDSKGRLPVKTHEFEYRDVNFKVVIQPAAIRMKDGTYKDFYPSIGEELLEDVLRKFFTQQQYAVHLVGEAESWVRFSLAMIKRELELRGKSRSIDEIKESLEILSSSVIKVYRNDESVYTSTILSDMTKVTRKNYVDDSTSQWIARLPALVSKCVNDATYRQYNYAKNLSLSTQLSRWLHKRLSHNYINASLFQTYQILLTTVARDSGLLPQARFRKKIEAFDAVLKELISDNILVKFERNDKNNIEGDKREIVDVLYQLHAHPNFVKDIKASNARKKKALECI